MDRVEDEIRIFPNNDPKINPRWYTIYTKPRNEKKVSERLENKSIKVYLPLRTETHQWSDRKKEVEVPLLRSYVFVRIPLKRSLDVLQTKGVMRFISFQGKYAPIPDYQINSLQNALESDRGVDSVNYFTEGEMVKVIQGPLQGVVGRVKRYNNKSRLVLSVDSLRASFEVNINTKNLKKLEHEKIQQEEKYVN